MPVRKWGWKELLKRHEPSDPATRAWGHVVKFKRNHSNCTVKDFYDAVAAPTFVAHVDALSGYAWRYCEQRSPLPLAKAKGSPEKSRRRRFYPDSDDDSDYDGNGCDDDMDEEEVLP